MLISFSAMFLAILVLGCKTGLILGASGINARLVFLISFAFAIMLYSLILLFLPHAVTLASIIDSYTFAGSMLLSAFLIFIGLDIAPCSGKESCSSSTNDLRRYMPAFLPCPFCLMALALAAILFRQKMRVGSQLFEISICLSYMLLTVLTARASRWMLSRTNMNPASIFNAAILFFGLATAVMGLFIPNFVSAARMPFSPMRIDSIEILLTVAVLLATVVAAGFLKFMYNSKKEM